jgi:uncharacterized protein YraI
MKRIGSLIFSAMFAFMISSIPSYKVNAAVQNPITRSDAEKRALAMINLSWTYDSSRNASISSAYAAHVSQPKQFNNVTTAQVTGIPYNWGGQDGIDTTSFDAPWTDFLTAIQQGAYAGNVNTDADHGYIQGTAGIDCSGFVQAVFNIKDWKLSTSTLFNTYFTKINLSDIKHMDILDRPGDHVLIFDRWGTLNGIDGAFTYESTWDQIFGGIQGTKQYFVAMDDINNGYIPGRYINIVDDTAAVPQTQPAPVQSGLAQGMFAQITNVNYYANFRSSTGINSSIIGTIPKGTVVYLISSSNGWYQVNYNGMVGWVSGTLLSQIPSGKYVSVNNVYMLNIRSNPSSTSSILGTLGLNQYALVTDYSSDGSWYKISINGIQGWAYSKYLKYIY